MWTSENHAGYDRSKLRYPTDLTDAKWALIAPLIPPAKRGGNKRTAGMREIVDSLMHALGTGCQWRAILKDLAPRSTVYGYFARWDWDGTLGRIHHALYVQCREQAGREVSATAGIIDSQSVKSAEAGGLHRSAGLRRRQEDQGQEASYARRHAGLAETCHRARRRRPGPLGDSEAASLRESRDGGVLLMATLFGAYPFLLKLYAGSGYQGPRFQAGLAQVMRQVDIEIIKRSDAVKGFAVLPRRWIVTGCTELPNQVLSGRRRLSAIIYGLRAVRTPKPG